MFVAVLGCGLLASCSTTKILQKQLDTARLAEASACTTDYRQTVRVSVVDSLGMGIFPQPLAYKAKRKVLPLLIYFNTKKEDLLYLGRTNLTPNLTGNLACHVRAALEAGNLHNQLGPGELTVILDSASARLPYYEDAHHVFMVYTTVSWAEVQIGPARVRCRARYIFKPDDPRPSLIGSIRHEDQLPAQEGTIWDGPRLLAKSYLPQVLLTLDKSLYTMAQSMASMLSKQAPK